jgi:hypothetical protein
MKNSVFWDIKTQFVPHRRHITSPLQSLACKSYVRYEVFAAMTMKNAMFWGVTKCGSVRTGVSEKRVASIIRVRSVRELGTLAVC